MANTKNGWASIVPMHLRLPLRYNISVDIGWYVQCLVGVDGLSDILGAFGGGDVNIVSRRGKRRQLRPDEWAGNAMRCFTHDKTREAP